MRALPSMGRRVPTHARVITHLSQEGLHLTFNDKKLVVIAINVK